MKYRKQLVLTGYRVQFVDLREPKPRTPQEEIHVADRQWLDAMGLTGQNVAEAIKSQYENGGYKVFSVQPIKHKRVVELDLCQFWEQTAPAIVEESPATTSDEGGLPGMTSKQAPEAPATLWDIGSALDDIHVELHRVSNMLHIFDEHIEDDLEFLKKSSNAHAHHFVSRYDMLRSLLEVMQMNLNGAIEELKPQINAVYEADRKARPRPLQAE